MSDVPSIFAQPRKVSSIEECNFYHSMDIPGHGEVIGKWDLRGREKDYLGNIALAGKTVLEIGTSSGYLCFWMEKQGAKVVAYDLSDDYHLDIIPYSNQDPASIIRDQKIGIRRANNAWWFAHERFQSQARVVYGRVYDLPLSLGRFDIVTLGSILLHLRDPFLAIQKAASLAHETLVVTDMLMPDWHREIAKNLGNGRILQFMPDARGCGPPLTWWYIPPEFVIEALRILGFNDITASRHQQRCVEAEIEAYTIVARRGLLPEDRYDREGIEPQLITTKSSYDSSHQILRVVPTRHILKHLLVTRILRRW